MPFAARFASPASTAARTEADLAPRRRKNKNRAGSSQTRAAFFLNFRV
jgi:hypothetical protein